MSSYLGLPRARTMKSRGGGGTPDDLTNDHCVGAFDLPHGVN